MSCVLVNSMISMISNGSYERLDEQAPSQRLNRISSKGFVFGYASALIQLIISLIILYSNEQSNHSLQVCIFMCGSWWLLFGLISCKGLIGIPTSSADVINLSIITNSWKQGTFRLIFR